MKLRPTSEVEDAKPSIADESTTDDVVDLLTAHQLNTKKDSILNPFATEVEDSSNPFAAPETADMSPVVLTETKSEDSTRPADLPAHEQTEAGDTPSTQQSISNVDPVVEHSEEQDASEVPEVTPSMSVVTAQPSFEPQASVSSLMPANDDREDDEDDDLEVWVHQNRIVSV